MTVKERADEVQRQYTELMEIAEELEKLLLNATDADFAALYCRLEALRTRRTERGVQ